VPKSDLHEATNKIKALKNEALKQKEKINKLEDDLKSLNEESDHSNEIIESYRVEKENDKNKENPCPKISQVN
jgi:chromosome segregation ATPase